MRGWIARHRPRFGALSQAAGERLYRLADAVAGSPFRGERLERPGQINIDGRHIDTIEDLSAFTGLSRAVVDTEVLGRRRINFRNEWLATPREVRGDRWFYLSSKAYLFGNATHFTDETFVRDFVVQYVAPGQRALDFGGGTGELALRLAGAGISTTVVELSALQRDFLRFRVSRHDLKSLVEVLEPWDPIPRCAFDVVFAMDVIEHLSNPREILDDELLRALRPSGVLIEDSPFVVDPWNPMHHHDFGLERFMRDRSFRLVATSGTARAWRRVSSVADEAPGGKP